MALRLNSWISSGLLMLKKGPSGRGRLRLVHEPAMLAILLLRLLRARDVSIDAIRPMSLYLSTRSREQLIREIQAGNEVLYSAGGRVGFAKPDGAILNDTGEATVLLAVDLVALLRRLWFAIEQHNAGVSRSNN